MPKLQISICLLFTILFSQTANSQHGINFYVNTELDRMMVIAKREGKDIFIDTYTQWCIPCKKLDKIFTDKDLGNYFNAEFVNVKFDMESEAGKTLQAKYDIFFMPTLLILDAQGNVKTMWDRGLIEADALLDLAMRVQKPTTYIPPPGVENNLSVATAQMSPAKIVPTSSVDNKEDKKSVIEDVFSNPNEKILYVMGSGDGPPDFVLYEEAYFKLQLMDGSHKASAKRYLESQEDWLTDKNMRFLHDFLYTTNSVEFKFYTDHLADFERLIGKDQVAQTIRILSNKRLFRGVPRPALNEAMALYSLMKVEDPAKSANKYCLTKLFEEEPETYISFSEIYIDQLGNEDHKEMDRLALTKLAFSNSKKSIRQCVKLLEKSIALAPNNPIYHEHLAEVYYRNNNKKKALEYIEKAFVLAKEQQMEKEFNKDLEQKILSL